MKAPAQRTRWSALRSRGIKGCGGLKRDVTRRIQLWMLVAALGGALTMASSASGHPVTTGPGFASSIYVVLTDTGIKVYNQDEEQRGVIVTFGVINLGKKPHNFALLGKKTPIIKPHGRARLVITLLDRGNFIYRSTIDKGAAFRGIFRVY